MKIAKKTTLFIVLVVFFVALDRSLKTLCLKGFFDQPHYLIPNIFSLNYAKNYGIAFSLPLSGPILTIVIGLIILILLAYWLKMFKLRSMPNDKCQMINASFYALTILIIGAILNFTDRIRYGFVIDYFDLKYFTVFNLADIMIVCAVADLLILSSKKYEGRKIF